MIRVVEEGRAIRLEAEDVLLRRREWRPWKGKGYRVLDDDGVTVWHERAGIRKLALQAFRDVDSDVFLFGSRASGKAGPRADYDVGFSSADPVPRALLSELAERLEELPIPSHVEVVDFDDVAEEFLEMVLAKRDIEIWKRRETSSLFTSAS